MRWYGNECMPNGPTDTQSLTLGSSFKRDCLMSSAFSASISISTRCRMLVDYDIALRCPWAFNSAYLIIIGVYGDWIRRYGVLSACQQCFVASGTPTPFPSFYSLFPI